MTIPQNRLALLTLNLFRGQLNTHWASFMRSTSWSQNLLHHSLASASHSRHGIRSYGGESISKGLRPMSGSIIIKVRPQLSFTNCPTNQNTLRIALTFSKIVLVDLLIKPKIMFLECVRKLWSGGRNSVAVASTMASFVWLFRVSRGLDAEF